MMLYFVAFGKCMKRETTYRYFCKVYKLSEIEGGNRKEIIKLSLAVAVSGSAKSLKSIQVPVTCVLKQNYRNSAYHLKVPTVLFKPIPISMSVENTCTNAFSIELKYCRF